MSELKKIDSSDLTKVCEYLDMEKNEKVYFQKDKGKPKVHEVVNRLLVPYGFEDLSKYQFKNIAGSSSKSADLIKNYYNGRGKVKHGFTKVQDIAKYCQEALNNSCFIPYDDILNWLKWSKKAINEEFITRRSGTKQRYDIEAMLDITKGHMPEEAFKHIASDNGYEVKLDKDLYGGTTDTDEGQDVLKFSEEGKDLKEPNLKVQIKDVQWFYLVSEEEFEGERSADIYVGFKTHWRKSNLGQKLFQHFDNEGKIFGSFEPLEGIRVEYRGWAYPPNFNYLAKGETHKGHSFSRNNNYFVYWNNLRSMSNFPYNKLL